MQPLHRFLPASVAVLCALAPMIAFAESRAELTGLVAIEVQPNQAIRLTWPESLGTVEMESAETLDADATWTTLTEQPSLVDGVFSLIVQAQCQREFFRLRLLDTPVIEARLTTDTGIRSNDAISSIFEVAGIVYNRGVVTRLTAGFDANDPASFIDVSGDVPENGQFLFTEERLEEIFGEPLADGHHTFHLFAETADNVTCSFDLGLVSEQRRRRHSSGGSHRDPG